MRAPAALPALTAAILLLAGCDRERQPAAADPVESDAESLPMVATPMELGGASAPVDRGAISAIDAARGHAAGMPADSRGLSAYDLAASRDAAKARRRASGPAAGGEGDGGFTGNDAAVTAPGGGVQAIPDPR